MHPRPRQKVAAKGTSFFIALIVTFHQISTTSKPWLPGRSPLLTWALIDLRIIASEDTNAEMKISDLVAGITMFITGTIFYYTNYKKTETKSRFRTRLGMVMMIAGSLLAAGSWMVSLILQGK